MEDRSNANMRIFKDPLPDHASGSKGIPINALEVDEPPSHPRYHSGDHEKVLRIASSRRYRFATVIKRGRSATEKGEIAPIDLTASDDALLIGYSSGESPSSQVDRDHLAPIQAHFGRKSCMSARHVTIPTRATRWFLRRFVQASHYASTSSPPKRRFEKSTTSRLLLESPEASHQPKKFQIPESSRKRLIEVTDAPTEKTRPTESYSNRKRLCKDLSKGFST